MTSKKGKCNGNSKGNNNSKSNGSGLAAFFFG